MLPAIQIYTPASQPQAYSPQVKPYGKKRCKIDFPKQWHLNLIPSKKHPKLQKSTESDPQETLVFFAIYKSKFNQNQKLFYKLLEAYIYHFSKMK